MPKNNQDSKKLGREEVLSAEELRKRFLDLKRFLGDNWGRIGLKLLKARRPDDLRKALRLVPSVEWCIPFRDGGAKCLLNDGSSEVGWRELRLTREVCEEVDRRADSLWSEYHDARRKAEEATNVLKGFNLFSDASRAQSSISFRSTWKGCIHNDERITRQPVHRSRDRHICSCC
jgi:hypothetical protein